MKLVVSLFHFTFSFFFRSTQQINPVAADSQVAARLFIVSLLLSDTDL